MGGDQPLGPPVLLGTSQHWDLWRFAADSFATNLEEIGLLGKTVVNATPWATETDNGETVTYAPITPQRFNEIMPKYYGHLSGLGLKVTAPDPAVVIARSDHKWGLAPFHYIDEVYSNLLDHVLKEIKLSEDN